MKNYLRLLYANLVLLLLAVPAYGNLSQQLNLEFNTLTNRDGLSNGQVNCILQDNRGYMWFATQSVSTDMTVFASGTSLIRTWTRRPFPTTPWMTSSKTGRETSGFIPA